MPAAAWCCLPCHYCCWCYFLYCYLCCCCFIVIASAQHLCNSDFAIHVVFSGSSMLPIPPYPLANHSYVSTLFRFMHYEFNTRPCLVMYLPSWCFLYVSRNPPRFALTDTEPPLRRGIPHNTLAITHLGDGESVNTISKATVFVYLKKNGFGKSTQRLYVVLHVRAILIGEFFPSFPNYFRAIFQSSIFFFMIFFSNYVKFNELVFFRFWSISRIVTERLRILIYISDYFHTWKS